MADPVVLHVLAVVFLATIVRSAFGFGGSLVAVPLLALRIPIATAAPLALLVSVTVSVVILVEDWRSIHLSSAGWLLFATLFGLPLGLAFLEGSGDRLVKALLGALIVAFSTWSLFGRSPFELKSERWPWLVGTGFVAGVMGGAYGMNGPPLVVYGTLRGWSADRFRATLQAYFLPASVLCLFGFRSSGLWGATVTHYYVLCLPVTVAAMVLGRALHRRLRGRSWIRSVHVLLVAIGATLLVQSLRA